MTIPANEAASALKDAEAAAGRAEAAHGYRIASAYLILWGVVWVIGNLASQVSVRDGQITWMIGAVAGMAASAWLGSRDTGRRGKGGSIKALLIGLAIGGFGWSVSVIAPPLSFAQSEAVACLAVGAIYIAMGVGAGLRLSAVGVAIMIGTVLVWSFARDQFFLWMAAVGGGGLILGGLWMRKV